jgi:hypothetical protein
MAERYKRKFASKRPDIEKICYACHKAFITPEKYIHNCKACDKIIRGLHTSIYGKSVKLDEDMFYPLYDILITYDVEDKTHDGYCSDSGEATIKKRVETIRYPLLKLFKTSDMNKNDFSIKSDNHILTSYYMPNIYGDSEKYCHGSYYKVKSAQVVKKETIELDG